MPKIITENFKAETAKELFQSFDTARITKTVSEDITASLGVSVISLTSTSGLSEGDFVSFGSAIPASSNIKILSFPSFTEVELTSDNLTPFQILGDIAEGDEILFTKSEFAKPSTYYIMGSVINGEDAIVNTQASTRNFLRKVIFGNKIDENQVRYMFKNSLWQQNVVYDQFDDTKDISTLNMFAVVLGDGSSTAEINQSSYKIFKCIKNNLGGQSVRTPSVSSVDDPTLRANDYQIVLDDGYIWKFMFEVSPAEYIVYGTSDLLPLNFPGDAKVISAARETVSDIKIESTQLNVMERYAPFTYIDSNSTTGVRINAIVDLSGSDKIVRVAYPQSSSSPYQEAGQYENMYFYTPNLGIIYDIIQSLPYTEGGVDYIQLYLRNSALSNISVGATLDLITGSIDNYSILPKIEVSRSLGERCIAYAKLDTFGNIGDTVIVNSGTEYKFATAKVIFPSPLSAQENNPTSNTYTKTTLRCIISPKGGHGSDPIKELAMSRLSIATTFSGGSPFIPGTNSYSQVGLVKNPRFVSEINNNQFDNRTKLTFDGDSLSTKVLPDYYVKQDVYDGSTIIETVVGQVHEVYYDSQANIINIVGTQIPNPDYLKTVILVTNNVGDFSSKFSKDLLTTDNGTVKFQQGPALSETDDPNKYPINSITYPDYVPYSGDLLHFVDFSPITRSEDRLEKIKFVFDF